MSWVGLVAHVGEKRNAHKILLEKPECKRLRWYWNWSNEVGWEGLDCISLDEGRDKCGEAVVNMVMNLQIQ